MTLWLNLRARVAHCPEFTIKRARAKNPNMKVISISVPSTAERIEELKAQLDDRKKYIVDGLLAGESYC